jgi:plastocyanin
MTVQRNRRTIPVLMAALLIAGISLITVAGGIRADSAQATMQDLQFKPASLTISVGTTVTWTNLDTAQHTTTSDQDVWGSPVMNKGDTFSVTFNQPGTFTYYCIFHANMHGTIVAQGSPTAPPPPTATIATAPPGAPTFTPAPSPTATLTTVPPTTTPTRSSFPGAAGLYARSQAALQEAPAHRYVDQGTALIPDVVNGTFRVTGDVAPRARMERLHIVTSGIMPGARTLDVIQIKSKAWIKDASTHGRWRRVRPASLRMILGFLANPLFPSNNEDAQNFMTVGPDTFQGKAVWRARWTEKKPKEPVRSTVDALIAQKNYLPYVHVRSLDDAASGSHLDERVTRTRYGERVTIKGPKVVRTAR